MNTKNCLSLWTAAILSLGANVSLSQTCIDPPPINGTPCVGCAPAGWSVATQTPDIISGNGPWPGGGYTASDITGNSTSGGTMGLFLSASGNLVEAWQTTLTGLTPGQTYQVAVEWQQATLSGAVVYTGGQLRLTVDGNSTDYTSTGTVAGDTWQQAAKVFTAAGTTANLVLGHAPSTFEGALVADSGAGCSIGPPPPPQAAATIPTMSEIALGAMSLLLAIWGVVILRDRRRNPNRMV